MDTVLKLVAYVYMYGPLVIALLLLVTSLFAWKSPIFGRSWKYRSILYVFIVVTLTSAIHTPIVITSPANHTVVHPGENVPLRIVLRPAFLSKLFPWVGLDVSRCYTCTDWPNGVVAKGALTGSPYTFTVVIPKNQPAGEIYVNAYAVLQMGGHAAMRSGGLGLVVE